MGGFFSTKKKHSVNTQVVRLIEDKDIHRSIPPSVVGSIMRNDEQIVENVLEGLVSGIGIRAHRMYAYSGNGYTYGRPAKQQLSSVQGDALVLALLQQQIGPTIAITYSKFAPLNMLHKGWVELVDSHGYKSSTNTLDVLSAAKGTLVYLKDMQPIVTAITLQEMSETGMGQWGTPPNAGYTPTRTDITLSNQILPTAMKMEPLAVANSLLVTYQWIVADAVQEDSFSIPFIEDDDTDYFQVKYSYLGNDGYWTYRNGAGTYPDLDATYTPDEPAFGSFFPFGYFRYNNTSMGADPNSAGYLSSKKLMKYIGIDYADMLAGINGNPDIADVEQAMLMMAIPANTINQQEQRYLFDFFDRMQLNDGIPLTSTVSNLLSRSMIAADLRSISLAPAGSDTPTNYTYVIKDARFQMTLGAHTIYRRVRGGVIAPVGKYASQFINHIVEISYYEPGYSLGDEAVLTTTLVGVPTYYYRHQISDATYIEIEVIGMNTRYLIWGGMTSIGDETDPTLLIPLDYSVTSNYNISDREELYARSLHLVFNSHIITKIKWYEKSAFRIIILIIVLIIAYYTGYFDPYLIALAAGGTALAVAVITAIVQYIIVSYLLKLFIKLVGIKAAFIIAIIAVVAAVYGVIDVGSLAGAPWAQKLLMVSSNLAAGIGDAIQQGIAELGKESLAFGAYVDSQLQLLEKAKSLLEQSTLLSPFVIFGESPDDFYNRTVHSGNIGVIGIDAISYYVDTALTLPELVDTIG